jgi:gamma-glutamyltranspeptidase / glutathione hydrolase
VAGTIRSRVRIQRYKKTRGAIAAGHELTAEAGCLALHEGGNAIDAAVAAAFMTFVAEPSLTTICGGGFMMAHDAVKGRTQLFDFFSEMPGRGRRAIRSEDLDFQPIHLDFGGTLQEFHIGRGAAAVPGNVHGLLTAHRRLGRLPIGVLLEPAIKAARQGVPLTEKQAFVFRVVSGTVMHSAGSRALYAPQGTLLECGEIFRNPDLGSTMEALGKDGIDLFYRGDIAQKIAREIGELGGLITMEDLAAYRTIVRKPLRGRYRGEEILTNPPPSLGGRLIGLSLQLLESIRFPKGMRGTDPQLYRAFIEIMWLVNHARAHYKNLTPKIVQQYRSWLKDRLQQQTPIPREAVIYDAGIAPGNTTHISTLDEHHNAASVTTSHGEGNGICVPRTGIILNNLLGEEDINPHGFHQWKPGTRLPSMMAPTILMHRGRPRLVLGSAGSNRLRTAIFQTIAKLIDTPTSIERVVNGPRIHWERGQLDIEPGLPKATLKVLGRLEGNHVLWDNLNLFFGGLHAVMRSPGRHPDFTGAGDSRRGGVIKYVR